jgi:hypothetical protein
VFKGFRVLKERLVQKGLKDYRDYRANKVFRDYKVK